jgi:hypothetical protein
MSGRQAFVECALLRVPGGPLSWEFVEHHAEPVSDADREHAARLVE